MTADQQFNFICFLVIYQRVNSMKIKELVQVCKFFKIEGYSRLRKAELLEHVISSMKEL